MPRGRVGDPLTDAPKRQMSAQLPSQGEKAKKIGHDRAVVFVIFGKNKVLSQKPRNLPRY